MRKLGTMILAALTAGSLMTGCAQTTSTNENTNQNVEQNTNEDVLQVYTSFYPLYDFATKVGGDKVNVVNLVPTGVEPHDYEPSARNIAGLEEADVFIYNGLGMESWVDKVLATLETEDLLVVEASENVDLLEGHTHECEEEHEHEHEEVEEHKHEEEHEHEEGVDPHVWTSIRNAKIEMENIKNAFVEADPENKDYYEANYATYAAQFDALDKQFTETLSQFENRDIIVAHEAFGYLCDAYDLNQVGIEGLNSDSEPDPARMKEIVEFAKEKDIKVIFFEELVSPKVAETIAKEIGAQTMVLNPLEGLTQEQLEAGEDYLSVMAENLEALKIALQ
ncbi:MAG: zinc ABC transporter substrate-binding protein [Cellulosilyticum sp.]|nr:zinc ABC transporter substrate-binding protein [Cellulosilyticum sp.]